MVIGEFLGRIAFEELADKFDGLGGIIKKIVGGVLIKKAINFGQIVDHRITAGGDGFHKC